MLRKRSSMLILSCIFIVTFSLVYTSPVYASPGTGLAMYKATSHLSSGLLGEGRYPEKAYDWNNGTYHNWKVANEPDYFRLSGYTTTGTGTVPPPAGTNITFVDFGMIWYSGASGGDDDEYRIMLFVGAGFVILQDWTASGNSDPTTTVWLDLTEPNDGTWDTTELGSIQFRIDVRMIGSKDQYTFYLYETWVRVFYYTYSTVWVNPASQSVGTSFSIDIDISTVDDLYGWEFKLYYDTTIITATSVTNGTFLSQSEAKNSFFSAIEVDDSYNSTHGRVWASSTLLGVVQGTSGSGTLATISFNIDSSDTSPLNLTDTYLTAYEYGTNRLYMQNHQVTHGEVTVTGVPEFPFGAALEIALAATVIFVWTRKRRKTKPTVAFKHF